MSATWEEKAQVKLKYLSKYIYLLHVYTSMYAVTWEPNHSKRISGTRVKDNLLKRIHLYLKFLSSDLRLMFFDVFVSEENLLENEMGFFFSLYSSICPILIWYHNPASCMWLHLLLHNEHMKTWVSFPFYLLTLQRESMQNLACLLYHQSGS